MIAYRKANIDDIEILIQSRINFLLEINPKPSKADLHTLKNNLRTYYLEFIPTEEYIGYFALDKDKITGIIGICFYRVPPSSKNIHGKKAYIMNLHVHPEYRRRGIGTKLFALVLEQAKTMGYRDISLIATELGRHLYKKHGFRENPEHMEYTTK